ncbi:MAG: aminopeptidase [Bacteroidales bacterium]|nr:aminopeptidase [Bacteroidales bacterium]MCF8332974.1 aminopeptidase [Bacteroidales bacterium]
MKNIRNYFVLFLSLCFFTSLSAQEKKQDSSYQFKTVADIPTTSVKDQHRSGTCWSFAATSFLETELLRKGYPKTDLSEMFFVRDAYIDKAKNYVQMHGSVNFSPGGQAHDVMNTLREKGMTTEKAYSGLHYGLEKHNHSALHALLAAEVKTLAKNKADKLNPSWLKVVEATLDEYLGEVPAEFVYEGDSYSPGDFADHFDMDTEDYVEITSYTHHDFYKSFRLELPDNWTYEDYYNVPLGDLMQIINNALENGYSVCWDGDVSEKGFSHSNGVAIVPQVVASAFEGTEQARWEEMTEKERMKKAYNFEKPVKEKTITQEDRQKAFEAHTATDDHLMHLTGIVKDQNNTRYYVTKNSWDDDSNDNGGYLNMSTAFLKRNTIAIMVHKDAIPKKIRKKLDL